MLKRGNRDVVLEWLHNYDEMRDYSIMRLTFKAKELIGVITLACGLIALPIAANASEMSQVNININGQLLSFPAGEQAPEIINSRTYVPLRVVSESLGAKVDWIADTKQVIINTKGEITSSSVINNTGAIEIVIDGEPLSIPSQLGKPYIKMDRTMIPLRAVGEALNCDVNWEDESKTVLINAKVQPPIVPPVVTPPSPEENNHLLDNQLLNELAQYRTNLKLMDGKVINSGELLNKDATAFTAEQLTVFRTYRDLLSKYQQTFTLPTGQIIKSEELTILGPSLLTSNQMNNWMSSEAPRIKTKMESMGRVYNEVPNLAELYIRIGEAYGIRGDLAYFQAVKETGYFQFTGAVQPWQNNYCGLWATGSPLSGNESFNGADPAFVRFEAGRHGAVFVSPEAGVEAHIQHLYAYATKQPLPAGKVLIDPRFSLVSRGIAPSWQQLNARWAVPGTTYGQSIIFDYWLKAFR